jgi:hypothetical protein
VLLCCAAAASLFGYPYLSLMPVMARVLFRDDARGLGVLMGGIGVGRAGRLGGAVDPHAAQRPHAADHPRLHDCARRGAAVIGFVRHEASVLALLAICGAAMVVCMALCSTSIQQRIPDEMRGRC